VGWEPGNQLSVRDEEGYGTIGKFWLKADQRLKALGPGKDLPARLKASPDTNLSFGWPRIGLQVGEPGISARWQGYESSRVGEP
jgi:hypothetical protein